MCWIKTIAYNETSGRLRKLYDRVKGPDNNVDNIMMLHSLRPHTMEGRMAIYKYVLHHFSNTLKMVPRDPWHMGQHIEQVCLLCGSSFCRAATVAGG